MFEGLCRYGFTENPYLRGELNPLSSATDGELLVRVDGFSKLDELDLALKNAVDQRHPLFFLVSGKSGSGRSSAANYIMARYCYHRGIDRSRFIIPNRQAAGYDKLAIFKKWFTFLRTAINVKRITLPQDLKDDFDSYMKNADPDTMEGSFQDLALRISAELGDLPTPPGPAGFGCCLEDVKTYDIINSALQIFDTVNTICVFTVGDYEEGKTEVIGPFLQKAKSFSGKAIELSLIQGADVLTVVEERWKKVCAHPSPFDAQGIEQAFSDKPRPVAQVLSLMGKAIDMKLVQFPNGPPYPEAEELRFSAIQIAESVKFIEGFKEGKLYD